MSPTLEDALQIKKLFSIGKNRKILEPTIFFTIPLEPRSYGCSIE
jgi:hypothetical protein